MNLINQDYIELKREIEVKGLLNYTPWYYFYFFVINILLISAFFIVIFYFKSWYAITLVSVPMTILFMQFAYLGHDAGHRAISQKDSINELAGQFSLTFLIGLCFSYWDYRHSQHHSNPNHEDLDPDIVGGDPMSFTKNQAQKKFGLKRLITRYQSFLIFPAFIIILFVLKITSFTYAIKNRKWSDLFLICSHLIFFLIFVPYLIGFPKAIVLYLLITILTNIHFSFSFFPNHLGMPILSKENKLSFVEKQILTSRNIKGGKFHDFILGGLNYQIEHHLFPRISRKNLPEIKSIVRDFCLKMDIHYQDDTLAKAWKDIFIYLNNIGKFANVKFSVLRAASSMV